MFEKSNQGATLTTERNNEIPRTGSRIMIVLDLLVSKDSVLRVLFLNVLVVNLKPLIGVETAPMTSIRAMKSNTCIGGRLVRTLTKTFRYCTF